jgi:hypothetical protein
MKVEGELKKILIRILEKDKKEFINRIDNRIKKLKEIGETDE